MTRKDICKRCVEERATHPLQRWGEMDEDAWERGFVWCCTKGYGTSANSINKPPGHCPLCYRDNRTDSGEPASVTRSVNICEGCTLFSRFDCGGGIGPIWYYTCRKADQDDEYSDYVPRRKYVKKKAPKECQCWMEYTILKQDGAKTL